MQQIAARPASSLVQSIRPRRAQAIKPSTLSGDYLTTRCPIAVMGVVRLLTQPSNKVAQAAASVPTPIPAVT